MWVKNCTTLPLINRLINEALLIADHVSIRQFQLIDIPRWFLATSRDYGLSRCLQAVSDWCVFVEPQAKMNGAYSCDL